MNNQAIKPSKLVSAIYVSEWEEGDIYTSCLVDTDTLTITDVEVVESANEHHESDYIEVCVGGKKLMLDAEDGQLTEAGKEALRRSLQQ
tara:strand:+ start:496 stop:762 length:267 start_codon:yes stop_codon:yes gene_type:complete